MEESGGRHELQGQTMYRRDLWATATPRCLGSCPLDAMSRWERWLSLWGQDRLHEPWQQASRQEVEGGTPWSDAFSVTGLVPDLRAKHVSNLGGQHGLPPVLHPCPMWRRTPMRYQALLPVLRTLHVRGTCNVRFPKPEMDTHGAAGLCVISIQGTYLSLPRYP